MYARSQTEFPFRSRSTIYAVVFVLMIAATLFGARYTHNANAADRTVSTPTGNTIPPGGTIPPPTEPGPSEGQVNILHVAPIAPGLIDTGVQICDSDGNVVTGYLYYQQQTGYFNLPIGTYDWFVAAAGDNCTTQLLDIPAFNVGAGARLLLIIFGDNDNQPLDSMLFVERAGRFIYHLPYIINR